MKRSWDNSWERIFQEQEWGKYPPEELIRFIARNFYGAPDRKKVKILDAGCGPGACAWYLAREGFSVYGIDGSNTAISRARKRLEAEGLKTKLMVGDLIQLPYPDGEFDAVIDNAAIECNHLSNIEAILAEVYRVLCVGGKFFSMAVKAGSWGYGEGDKIERNTFTNIKVGLNIGESIIHFFTESEVRRLLKQNRFRNIEIECSARTINNQKNEIVHLVITAEK